MKFQQINLFFYFSQVIILSASANKLAKLKGHAATYASLIMEELDPDDRGYIEVAPVQKHRLLSHQEGYMICYAHGVLRQCRFGSWRRCSVAW